MALSIFPLISCGDSNPFYSKVDYEFGIETNISPFEVRDTKFINNEEYFKMHGRFYYDESRNVKFFNFSSSGFEVTFRGTTLEACLYTTNANNDTNRPYLAVCVDHDYDPEHATPIQLTSGVHSNSERYENGYFIHEHVVLAHDLENTTHTIRVYKRSECLISKVGVKSVSTDGEILPVEAKSLDLKMEFYGDSVTCGYAIESDNYYERFCSRTENSTKTYANYCANILNSDVSHISCGGYPMYKSLYSEGCSPDSIPEMVSLADVEYQTINRHTWDNSQYIPDVVVIALGANDGSKLIGKWGDSDYVNSFVTEYKKTYKEFINKLFTLYPDALIVVSDEILPIADVFEDAMDQIVEEFNSTKVIRATYTAYYDAKDRTMPGEGHPNKEMNQIAGRQLAELITNALNK